MLFVASDNNASSGAFLSMCTLADLLQTDYNYEVFIVVPREGTGSKLLKEKAIKYFLVPSYDWVIPIDTKLTKKFLRIKKGENRYTHNAAVVIATIIQKYQIDIVHVNTTYAYVGALAALHTNKPFIWHFREFLEEDQGRTIWCKEKAKKLINKSNRIIAISKSIQNKYSPIFGEKIIQIYNGLDNAKFKTESRTILTSSRLNFIFVGGLSERKGCFFLISALEEYILSGHIDFEITFVGKCTTKFEQRLKKSILYEYSHCVGYQKNTENFYNNADIAFTCSDSEAFGRITVEAMMCGCLVIGVNAGCTPEIITSRKTGYLYKKNDIEDFLHTLEYACKNKSESISYAHEGQKYANTYLNSKLNAKLIEEQYEQLLNDTTTTKNKFINLKLAPYRLISAAYMKLVSKQHAVEKDNLVDKIKQLEADPQQIKQIQKIAKTDKEYSYEIALFYKNKINDLKSYEKWLAISSKLGYDQSTICLIDILSKRSSEDKEKSFYLAQDLSKKGHAGAQYRLG